MRLIVREERPQPGAPLRITDVNGIRITALVINTTRGQLADLQLRHRRRARAEDRIRAAKDTGPAELPLHDCTRNEIWCAIVALAGDLLAWMQTRALNEHHARRWEPDRLRLRLLSSQPGTRAPVVADCCTWPPRHRSPPSPFGHSPAGRSWPRHDRSTPADPRHPVPTTRGPGRPRVLPLRAGGRRIPPRGRDHEQ
jgi:hypothetical protein